MKTLILLWLVGISMAPLLAGISMADYIDGKKISEYSKVAYPKGGFGLREWQSKSLLDDVEVYDAGGSSIRAVTPQGKLATTWSALKANCL